MNLARAIASGNPADLPSRRDEDWRWTDIAGLIRELPPASPEGVAGGEGPFDALADETVTIVNGRGPGGLTVSGRRTVALRFVSASEGTSHAGVFAITVAADAQLTLLESYEGQAGGYLANALLSLDIGQGARVERIVLAADAADGVSVSQASVKLAPQATFAQTVLTNGARRQRLETHLTHPGHGAAARMDGAYILSDRRHGDITTVVDHAGPDGTTTELIKGVVRDQARAVFQGRILVEKGSDGTDARLGHHALLLSDRAEVDAKPELLIFADDVQCAHGNTIGALDDNALFYARQRGIPDEQARAMLTGAFVGEVIDRIEHDGARRVAQAWVDARLGVTDAGVH
jgi:Fe-S cluster assembly protein SufD